MSLEQKSDDQKRYRVTTNIARAYMETKRWQDAKAVLMNPTEDESQWRVLSFTNTWAVYNLEVE